MKQFITITLTILALVIIGKHLLHETPNERAERINRMAETECSTGNSEYDKNCYKWYYEQIEDRL